MNWQASRKGLETMYYITTSRNVTADLNTSALADKDRAFIQTCPGWTTGSHEELTEGHLGCLNGWDRHAYGEYETEAAARAALTSLFGAMRELDLDDEEVDAEAIAAFAFGEFPEVGDEESVIYFLEDIQQYLKGLGRSVTEEEIAAKVAECLDIALEDEFIANGDAIERFIRAENECLETEREDEAD